MEQKVQQKRKDKFDGKAAIWIEAVDELQRILQELPLTEEKKWGWPCYLHEGKNIVLIHGFKEYCALLLFKGALLEDTHQLLVQQTEQVQAARQLRFTTVQQIKEQESAIKSYIMQAIAVEQSGKKVVYKQNHEQEYPSELLHEFEAHPAFEQAFRSLTPGRQRAYLFQFNAAKQSKTRIERIKKFMPQILQGRGINE